jgi:zinc D-Ala-D-Ala carboxypeptidase
MKKSVLLLFLLVCLVFAIFYIEPLSQDRISVQLNVKKSGDDINFKNAPESESIKVKPEKIYQGNLLLVNSEYPVHEQSIKSDVVNLFEHKVLTKGYGLLEQDIYLSEVVAQAFSKMVAAARDDGINHFIISSGFRSFDEQSALYQEMGSDYALPAGYSEHNLGLSIDVGSTLMKMEEAPEGQWIEENAWEHGFILRYPKDKTDVTGIQYEPWHIRYVGLPHSAIMKAKNFVLEEYLDYLQDEQYISANVDGKTYTVSYYPVSKNTTIKIPKNSKYKLSGNNIDGVIVTAY